MKCIVSFFAVILISFNTQAQAQQVALSESMTLRIDSLNDLSSKIINEYELAGRMHADSMFTRVLVRTLLEPNSFQNPLSELMYISILHSPDNRFRIFTWQLAINENLNRQRGAIQMNTSDGKLKLIPLIDKSDVIQNKTDTITNNLNWIGAVYYKILANKTTNGDVYTLIGYDENNIRSTKKMIEFLQFENEEPIFGGRFIASDTSKEELKNTKMARYIMEYKKDAAPRLNYDSSLNLIVMEHLISETNEPKKKFTLIPDGDYEAFEWKNEKWQYIKKLFTEITEEGLPPTPVPLKEEDLF